MFQEMCFEDDKLDPFPRIQGADSSQKDCTKPEHLSILFGPGHAWTEKERSRPAQTDPKKSKV